MSSVRVLTVVVLTFVLAGAPVAASTVAGGSTDERITRSGPGQGNATGIDGPVVVQTATVGPHPADGFVSLNLSYRIGSDAGSLVVFDSEGMRVVDAHGFNRQHNGRWKWVEGVDDPWLSVKLLANQTSRRFGGYKSVATDDWALVHPPQQFAYYSQARNTWITARGNTTLVDLRLRVRGDGYAGTSLAYLGPYETYNRSVRNETLTMVVPNASALRPQRGTVLQTLTTSRTQLSLDANRDRVNVFVAPRPIRKGGLAFEGEDGTVDVWVSANESNGAPANIWLHEWMHTRQHMQLGPGMGWFVEASASYYAGLLSVRQVLGDRKRYEQFVTRLHKDKHAFATLSNRSTWSGRMTPYSKGQRVLAALDVRIRNATNDTHTLATVFRRMNRHEGPVTYDDFAGIVETVANESMDDWLDRHVRGREPVSPSWEPYDYVAPHNGSDADGDSLSATAERGNGTNPFVADTDGDALPDSRELVVDTDPTVADTDGDGYADGTELDSGSNPVNPFVVPHSDPTIVREP